MKKRGVAALCELVFCSLGEFIVVTKLGPFDGLDGLFASREAFDFGLLAELELLIDGEEVTDFFEKVLGKLVDIFISGIDRVVLANGDDFLIFFAGIDHIEHTDGRAADERCGEDGLAGDDHDVEWVIV